MAMQAPRRERRKDYSDAVRMSLLEDDADGTEVRQNRIEAKLDAILRWLVVGAVTFASSAVLLGIQVAQG